jgi:hypothetical protein
MSDRFPEVSGSQVWIRVIFACGVTIAVIVGAYLSIAWLAALRP